MRRFGLALVLVAFLAIAAAAPASAVTIKARGQRWRPPSVNIDRGDRVRWRFISGGHHTVTSYGGGWSFDRDLHTGSVSRRFRQRGVFKFRCRIHSTLSGGNCSGMCGRVRV